MYIWGCIRQIWKLVCSIVHQHMLSAYDRWKRFVLSIVFNTLRECSQRLTIDKLFHAFGPANENPPSPYLCRILGHVNVACAPAERTLDVVAFLDAWTISSFTYVGERWCNALWTVRRSLYTIRSRICSQWSLSRNMGVTWTVAYLERQEGIHGGWAETN